MSSGASDILMEEMATDSGASIEIKIKTMDSQTYTMQVDKQMPVPVLKQQIASMTGIVTEHQRLIFRGKVLKDDQLLSAYHMEDGHTLHLVVRDPASVPPVNLLNDPAPGSASNNHGQYYQ
ncbi:Ubiquitin-like domain-containing protein, partial [Drosera capensis]